MLHTTTPRFFVRLVLNRLTRESIAELEAPQIRKSPNTTDARVLHATGMDLFEFSAMDNFALAGIVQPLMREDRVVIECNSTTTAISS